MDDAASKGDTREVDDAWQRGCSTTTIQQSIDEMEMELLHEWEMTVQIGYWCAVMKIDMLEEDEGQQIKYDELVVGLLPGWGTVGKIGYLGAELKIEMHEVLT